MFSLYICCHLVYHLLAETYNARLAFTFASLSLSSFYLEDFKTMARRFYSHFRERSLGKWPRAF